MLYWLAEFTSHGGLRAYFLAIPCIFPCYQGIRQLRLVRRRLAAPPSSPVKPAEAAALGREVSIRSADHFATTVLPIIQSIRNSGTNSLRGIAIALNSRGIRTARGGQWQVSNVRNLLGRRTEQLAQVAL